MLTPPAHNTLPPVPVQSIAGAPPAPDPHKNPANGDPPGYSIPSQTGVVASQTTYPHSSTSTSKPGAPGNTQGPNALARHNSKLIAIVLGVILGVLAFMVAAATVWYLRQRRVRSGPAFSPLDDDDSEHAHSITAIRIAGMREKGPRILAAPRRLLNLVGLGQSRHLNRSRRDILADEDRSFDWIGSREASRANSSFGGPSAPGSIRGWSNAVSDSFASLRNFARGVGSAPRSREPSTDINWEKLRGDPFPGEAMLMAEGLSRDQLPERIPHPYAMAGTSESYIDPFSDQDSSSEGLVEAEPVHTEHRIGEVRRLPTPLVTTLPPSADFVPLSPVVEQASQNSLSNSSTSLHTPSDQPAGSSSSHGVSRSPRPSSILDPHPPTTTTTTTNLPIRRSDSWWSRFANRTLLERRSTESTARNSGSFIDFRDPNPPPRFPATEEEFTQSRLSDIAEATSSRRPSSAMSRTYSGAHTRRPTLYRETAHGRSVSSLQTANTETLERVGGTMEVIQHDATLDSHYTSPTTISTDDEFGASSPGLSPASPPLAGGGFPRRLMVRGEPSHWSTESSIESPMMHTPLASGAATPPHERTDPTSHEHQAVSSALAARLEKASSISEDLVEAPPRMTRAAEGDNDDPSSPPSPPSSPASPGVADRVRAFERRMSRDNEPPPAPTNTRRREERTAPRPVVRYGLVPRPSLFVANPDGGRGSDGG
jgi:hypothetical protein